MLKVFIISILTLISGSAFSQESYDELPQSLKFVDTNKDDSISGQEASAIFDIYSDSPNRQNVNDIVDDVETTIIDLIGYLENIDCSEVQKSLDSKKFIETYIWNIRNQQKDSAVTLDKINAYNNDQLAKELSTIKKTLDDSLTSIKESIKTQFSDTVKSYIDNLLGRKLKINGLIDMYYSYDINNPENNSLIGSTGAGRVFDRYHNQIMFSMAQTKFDYSTEKFKALVDLTYGLGGEIANYGNKGTAIIIKQIYVSQLLGKKTTITAGNFSTHIGYEVIESSTNFNYSVSNLFANGPFYHTGIKMDHALNDKFGIMCGLVSGWDKIQDDNKAKTIISQLSLKPNSKMSFYLNWIGGNEAPTELTGDTIKAYKQLFDLTATLNPHEKITIGLNGAFGINRFDTLNSSWGGAALYLQYSFNPKFALGLRSEYFDDSQHVQYLGASYLGQTFTFIYNPISNVSIKLEGKYDEASQNIYWKGKNNELTNTQTTFGIAIIGTY